MSELTRSQRARVFLGVVALAFSFALFSWSCTAPVWQEYGPWVELNPPQQGADGRVASSPFGHRRIPPLGLRLSGLEAQRVPRVPHAGDRLGCRRAGRVGVALDVDLGGFHPLFTSKNLFLPPYLVDDGKRKGSWNDRAEKNPENTFPTSSSPLGERGCQK